MVIFLKMPLSEKYLLEIVRYINSNDVTVTSFIIKEGTGTICFLRCAIFTIKFILFYSKPM